MAARAGISYEHLNHIENYKALPSLAVLVAISEALGYSRLSALLRDDEARAL